jgi:hypothetical protein
MDVHVYVNYGVLFIIEIKRWKKYFDHKIREILNHIILAPLIMFLKILQYVIY